MNGTWANMLWGIYNLLQMPLIPDSACYSWATPISGCYMIDTFAIMFLFFIFYIVLYVRIDSVCMWGGGGVHLYTNIKSHYSVCILYELTFSRFAPLCFILQA